MRSPHKPKNVEGSILTFVHSFLAKSPGELLPPLLLLSTALKVLLIPAYRSTDFDVHRNWLAVTKQTPISEWYWNDVDGGTVHTLDYPPAFAFFEYCLSNHQTNPLVRWLLPQDGSDRCLELLPDADNEPSDACVLFQRTTVILSDLFLWAGAYFACRAYHSGKPHNVAMTSFLLIVFNPALLWLDHIHFQYNGMMIGVLLASLGCLFMGNNVSTYNAATARANKYATTEPKKNPISYDLYHLAGAALFALLLNLKHLYLCLAPLYFCYLLERYCLTPTIPPGKTRKRFLLGKFLLLAVVTGTVLAVPWIPFLAGRNDKKVQFAQIVRRLFPFGRGLVHDYWAGNVWALYKLADKGVRAVVNKLTIPLLTKLRLEGLAGLLEGVHLPEPSPIVCALLLMASVIPGLQAASLHLTNKKLIESVVYVSFCAFMLAYHVHEKAILTTMVPLTLLVQPSARGEYHNLLFWNISLWGLLGLFPLLFRPIELAIKLSSYVCYMGFVSWILQTPPKWMEDIQYGACGLVAAIVVLLEVVPIQGKWEFFPLMVTSISCAFGLSGCWGMSHWLLVRVEKEKQT